VVQSATFADAPVEARRLIRRRQRGHDAKKLDQGQYGYLASRTAILHPDGGRWTLSRAIGEAPPQLEAVEREQGIDFGDLVRERRRQRGLPLPIAEKMLPFRPTCTPDATSEYQLLAGYDGLSATEPCQFQAALAEGRVAEACADLQAAEMSGASRQVLDRLEEAYFTKVATYRSLTL
jgi:hypothetical protein